MSFTEWLGVVSGIISVFAFVFAVWVWMRSDMRVKELTGTLQAIFDISGSILWETMKLKGENADARLRQAERAIGLASSIHTLSSKYVSNVKSSSGTELTALVERGIVWTLSMLWNIETSVAVKEVWLVTPDLKPDVSDPEMGEVVGGNLKKGNDMFIWCPPFLALPPSWPLGLGSIRVSIPQNRDQAIGSR